MINLQNQTLASIATSHYQSVPVLEKYHLDFCCGGKRTLAEVCTEKGIDIDEVISALETANTAEEPPVVSFADMNAEQLIRHILVNHHFYLRQTMPVIEEHLIKVASRHGERFPHMKEVLSLFVTLKKEMDQHMQKEEIVLFPRIREVELMSVRNRGQQFPEGYIDNPVHMMEHEHDEAGSIVERIRVLTGDYTPPEGACNTFHIVLKELNYFEEDLHKHVHLENNLLFPLATRMISHEMN